MYVSDGSSGTGVTNGETIMAIFSDHDEFTVSSSLNVNFEGLGSANVYAELNDTTPVQVDPDLGKIEPGIPQQQADLPPERRSAKVLAKTAGKKKKKHKDAIVS